MFCTTLRIDEQLGAFLRQAAKAQDLSVNAFLAELVRREREQTARQDWARDWSAYARDQEAQDVGYALAAQAELAAEPRGKPYAAPARSRKA